MNTKEALLQELERTDRRTRELFADLGEAELAVPYERGINPPVWELGHAAFFYELFVLRGRDAAAPRMPGYDEIWDSFEIPHRERWRDGVVPSRETTFDYYRKVIDEVRGRIESRPLAPEDLYLYKYSIFHQNMHIESMIWCRQTLGYQGPSSSVDGPGPAGLPSTASGDGAAVAGCGGFDDVSIAGGHYSIGMPGGVGDPAAGAFAFDNEKPGSVRPMGPFAISKTLVSNGRFLAFVEDGGYEDEALWSFGGRHWLRAARRVHPAYWKRGGGGSWEERHFDTWVALAMDAPVLHVSFWEAEAFCEWAGRRLPTEFEWEVAARGARGDVFPWGDAMDVERVDMDGGRSRRAPVHAFATGVSGAGCLQMLGTAWEWTSSQYLPYDGFRVDVYPYMSTLQFGDHKTTRGGSCATSSCLIRNTYRQAYLPDRHDVFVGFRTCARP